MDLIKWSENKFKKFTIWDIAIFKTAIVLFGIIIGAYISTFVKTYLWYLIVIFVVLYGYLLYKIFK